MHSNLCWTLLICCLFYQVLRCGCLGCHWITSFYSNLNFFVRPEYENLSFLCLTNETINTATYHVFNHYKTILRYNNTNGWNLITFIQAAWWKTLFSAFPVFFFLHVFLGCLSHWFCLSVPLSIIVRRSYDPTLLIICRLMNKWEVLCPLKHFPVACSGN